MALQDYFILEQIFHIYHFGARKDISIYYPQADGTGICQCTQKYSKTVITVIIIIIAVIASSSPVSLIVFCQVWPLAEDQMSRVTC